MLFCFVCIETGNLPTVVWGRRGSPQHFFWFAPFQGHGDAAGAGGSL